MSMERAKAMAALDFSVGTGAPPAGTYPIPGDMFGLWVVTGEPEIAQSGGKTFRVLPVQCNCGNTSRVTASALRRGRSKRCEQCRLNLAPEVLARNKLLRKG